MDESELPVLEIESAERKERLKLALQVIKSTHVYEVTPGSEGNKSGLSELGDAKVGVMNGKVERPDPPLNVSEFKILPGQTVALIGPNGSGKSTLFDAIGDHAQAFFDLNNGNGAARYGDPVHARENLRIARLSQEEALKVLDGFTVEAVLGTLIEDAMAEFPENWDDPDLHDQNMKNVEAQQRIEELRNQYVDLLEMGHTMERNVEELSGGERTKLALFMILLSEPDVLLLDEPTNHLDLESIYRLQALFDRYISDGMAVCAASHVDWYLRLAGRNATAEITWDGKNRSVKMGSSYERYIQNSARESQSVISKSVPWDQPGYDYKKGEMLISSSEPIEVPDSPLDEVNLPFTIMGGDRVLLVGKNGTGKTKLMEELVEAKTNGNFAYLPQFWPEELMGEDVMGFFNWVQSVCSPHDGGSVYDMNQPAVNIFRKRLKELNFGGLRQPEQLLTRPFASLSGGEQRLLWFLAVSYMPNIDVLMMDEPTNHMDLATQTMVGRIVESFPGTVIVSTHDPKLMQTLGKTTLATASTTKVMQFQRTGDHSQVSQLPTEQVLSYQQRAAESAGRAAQRVK